MTADVHIHMILDGVYFREAIDAHKAAPVDGLIRSRLEDYARRGVRFLRDGGDAWGVSLRARALAKDYGIDYRSPAFPIYKKGHYGAFIGRGFGDFSEYLRLLDEAEEQQADFIKVMISGLIDFSRPNTLTGPGPEQEEIYAMISAAHDRGFAIMAHANGDRAVNAALDAGVNSIEHGAFLSRETLKELAESETVWVPTLATIGNLIGSGRYPRQILENLLEEQQEKLNFAAAQGAKIAPGSDAGAYCVPHESALERECTYLKAALGPGCDALLERGAKKIRESFHR